MITTKHDVGGYVSAAFDGLTILFDRADVVVVEQTERPRLVAKHAKGLFVLPCDDVRVHPAGWLKLYRLPAPLKGKRSPFHAYASVGDRIAYELADASGWGYLVVQPAAQPVHFGQMWECPYCHHYPNWAEVSIAGDRIEQIDAVRLNGATLARLHFLDEDVGAFIAEAVGRELTEAWDDLVPLLREYLGTPGREL